MMAILSQSQLTLHVRRGAKRIFTRQFSQDILIQHVRFELPLLGLLAKAAKRALESLQRPFRIVLLSQKLEKSFAVRKEPE